VNKRLYFLLISLIVIGCSNNNSIGPQEDCYCGMEITSSLPQVDGVYELEYNSSLAQTYSTLYCQTECGWSQHVKWDSDYQYQIYPGQWTSLVNPSSMTDEHGDGQVVFAVWEEFIGYTVTIYGAYIDDCGHQYVDSVKVKVVDNE
tara:strand:- start:283 stop:720 length:438 start_codon:yes stop_codon:yes gene_type:complete